MLLFYFESFCNDSVFYYLSKIIIHNITPSADYDATTRRMNARKILIFLLPFRRDPLVDISLQDVERHPA